MAYSRKTFPVEIREEGKEKRDGKIKRSRNTNFTIRGKYFFFSYLYRVVNYYFLFSYFMFKDEEGKL